jgi:hypothetical protein
MRQIDFRAGDDADGLRRVGALQQILGESACVENLQRPRHRRERATGRIHLGPALEHHHRTVCAGQVSRRCQPRGPGTDDDDIDMSCHFAS